MKKFSKKYWEEHYLQNKTGWDVGYATKPITNYLDQINDKTKKILIPGAGNAYEAEYLFNNNFLNVFVLDFSIKALENFKNRVPNFPDSHLICDDFFNHNKTYDFIIEQTFFCSLDRTLRNNYVKHSASLLNQEGRIIGLLFNDEFGSDFPPFGGTENEYRELFQKKFDIVKMEIAYNSIKPRLGRELFINLKKR